MPDSSPALDTPARFRGCLLGGAVGDALGAPVEFMSAQAIRDKFGDGGIRDFVRAYGRRGAITDDTQMTLFTAEAMVRVTLHGSTRGPAKAESAAWAAYRRWYATQTVAFADRPQRGDEGWLFQHAPLFERRAPGITCISALRDLDGAWPAPNDSKGCGGVMRVAPVGLALASAPGPAHRIFELASNIAAMTHGHPSGFLAAGAFAVMIAWLVRGRALPEAIDAACAVLREQPRHAETLAALEHAQALARTRPHEAGAIAALGEGWVAEEALAMGVYAALYAASVEDGVVLAVNHGGDSDSTGSIAGNLLGAMHGVDAIPSRWLESLELREVIDTLARDLARVSLDGGAAASDADFVRRYPPA